MAIGKPLYNSGKGTYENIPVIDIRLGTTQIKKVYKDGKILFSTGFIAATVTDDGSGPFNLPAGNYTFNVISSDGAGTGGQIVGSVSSSRRLTGVVSVLDGGSNHSVGDTLVLEMVGANWFQDPEIEVTA